MRERQELGVATRVDGDWVVWQERGGVHEEMVDDVIRWKRIRRGQVLARDVRSEGGRGRGRIGCERKEEESGPYKSAW